jgi:hypothetical protein
LTIVLSYIIYDVKSYDKNNQVRGQSIAHCHNSDGRESAS